MFAKLDRTYVARSSGGADWWGKNRTPMKVAKMRFPRAGRKMKSHIWTRYVCSWTVGFILKYFPKLVKTHNRKRKKIKAEINCFCVCFKKTKQNNVSKDEIFSKQLKKSQCSSLISWWCTSMQTKTRWSEGNLWILSPSSHIGVDN